jgi:RNA polymerase sigma factor (sigma-70 family)
MKPSDLPRYIRTLVGGPGTGVSDVNLLDRFVTSRDEAAFELLVYRHGPLVLGVCRRVLGNAHDAEDAFQATFLTLARKAGSVGQRSSLAGWLHTVAQRIALRLRARRARRSAAEQPLGDRPVAAPGLGPADRIAWRELAPLLDREVNRLPEKYRAAFILCSFEGKTHVQAADELGLPAGSVGALLEKARRLLRQRLTRRGVTLSGPLLAALLAENAAGAPLAEPLLASTVQAAMALATGAAPSGAQAAAALARGALRGLAASKLKCGAVLLAAALLLLGGGAVALLPSPRPPADVPPPEPAPPPPGPPRHRVAAGGPLPLPVAPAPPTVPLSGHVLDAAGRPVPHAHVAALAPGTFGRGQYVLRDSVLCRVQAGPDGRFTLEVPTDFATPLPEDRRVKFVAWADGHAAITFGALRLWEGHPEVQFRLPPAQDLRGRLLGPDGRPGAGAQVHVVQLGAVVELAPPGAARGAPSFWPKPAVADEKGDFVLRGLNRAQGLRLEVRDDRFARRSVALGPRSGEGPFTLRLAPGHVLTGRARAADTGRPLANVRLSVGAYTSEKGRTMSPWHVEGQTDREGRFRLTQLPRGRLEVSIHPPESSPYLALVKQRICPEEGAPAELEVDLPRGIVVEGRVTDEEGRAVPEAHVQYLPRQARDRSAPTSVLTGVEAAVCSGPDGKFRLAVPPGAGHLFVHGPNNDYVSRGVDLIQEIPGGTQRRLLHGDAVVPLDLKPGLDRHRVKVSLRRGVAIAGRARGPAGGAVAQGLLLCPSRVSPLNVDIGHFRRLPVRDGQFTLPGCDPDYRYSVLILDSAKEVGAVVELSAEGPGREPPPVRLARCGQAKVRFTDREGQPVAGLRLCVFLCLRREHPRQRPKTEGPPKVNYQGYDMRWVDPRHYAHDPRTDAEGRVTLPALVPGALYLLEFYQAGVWRSGPEFTLAPDQTTLELHATVTRPH